MPPGVVDEKWSTYCSDVMRKTNFGRNYRFAEIGILYQAKCLKEVRIDQNCKMS
jgi:hypothetical protein